MTSGQILEDRYLVYNFVNTFWSKALMMFLKQFGFFRFWLFQIYHIKTIIFELNLKLSLNDILLLLLEGSLSFNFI